MTSAPIMAPGSLPLRPSAERIARGTGTPEDARSLFDELAAETRALVAGYLAPYSGRRGVLDPKLRGYPGWPKGQPRGAVLHVPALHGRVALDTLDTVRRFMVRGPGQQKSTHLVLGWPDGQILVPVHPRDRAWHAGRANDRGLGIDVVSPGPLVPGADGSWRRWDGRGAAIVRPDGSPLVEEDVLDFGDDPACRPWKHRYWHCPTPAQVFGLALALRASRLLHPTLQPDLVVRHADLDPANRVDPGPGIPLEAVRVWAWGSEDLLALRAEVEGGDSRGWAAFLGRQWLAPQGIATALDLRCPGRPVRSGEVG